MPSTTRQALLQALSAAGGAYISGQQLAGQLETVKGKKSYGYLSKPVKKTVDEVVDKLEDNEKGTIDMTQEGKASFIPS